MQTIRRNLNCLRISVPILLLCNLRFRKLHAGNYYVVNMLYR